MDGGASACGAARKAERRKQPVVMVLRVGDRVTIHGLGKAQYEGKYVIVKGGLLQICDGDARGLPAGS